MEEAVVQLITERDERSFTLVFLLLQLGCKPNHKEQYFFIRKGEVSTVTLQYTK